MSTVQEGALSWDRVHSLASVAGDNVTARASAKDITLFNTPGVAIEDVALTARAYDKALEQKSGIALPDLAC